MKLDFCKNTIHDILTAITNLHIYLFHCSSLKYFNNQCLINESIWKKNLQYILITLNKIYADQENIISFHIFEES